eukprot:COSAG04_NODE_2882_length_3428_cov_1.662661_2_plen_137_part_00
MIIGEQLSRERVTMGRKASHSVNIKPEAFLGRQHGGDVRLCASTAPGALFLGGSGRNFVLDFAKKGPKRQNGLLTKQSARLPTTKYIGAIRRPHTHRSPHSCGVPGVPRMVGEAAWPATSPSARAAAASACGETKY